MKRIQRRRTKGWKTPPRTKYVGRPSKWGNYIPLHTRHKLSLEQTFRAYKIATEIKIGQGFLDLNELKGYDFLSCWCPLDQPCHADILIELLEVHK